VHLALEAYYLPGFKRGPAPALTFERLYDEDLKDSFKAGIRDEDGEWLEMGELGVLMLEEYTSHYGSDERWEIIATEQPFHWPVYDDSGKLLFTYVGVVDLIVRDRVTGHYYMVDHKTCKDDPTKKNSALALDEQTGAYWSYGQDALRYTRKIPGGLKLDGILFNFLRKGVPDLRPKNNLGQSLNKPSKEQLLAYYDRQHRALPEGSGARGGVKVEDLMEDLGTKAFTLGSVSEKQPTALFHREPVYRDDFDAEMVRSRILAQAQQMRFMRKGKLPVYKVPGTLHNPHCKWCPFMDMCELHETGADWETFRDQTMTVWSPYDQHAIYEGDTTA
jgi:hypothetical protein